MIRSLHQPLPRHRRRGRRDHHAGARPRTPEAPRRAAPRRADRGLRGRGAVAAVGAAGGHHVPLDGQLAHRADQRRSRRERAADGRPAPVAHAAARPAAARRLRQLRPAAALHLDRSTRHGLRTRRRLRQRRGGRRAHRAAARVRPGGGRVLRSLAVELRPALESSALLAAIQACPGVVGVSRSITAGAAPRPGRRCRTRSRSPPTRSCGSTTTRARPEAGSLQVTVKGSK